MIAIQDVSFFYNKKKQLLSNINLSLKAGNVYGLLGLNGVGKTTLLNNISGTLFPKSGQCLFNGVETRLRLPETLGNLFIVPEQFELPKLSGDKFVELHSPFYSKFDHSLLNKTLTEFGIDRSIKLSELSFGQRKKFLIAFAISTNTELLLFDEPTNGLDIPSKSQFRRMIASLELTEKCIIISTHQVRDLGAMIDHILVLKDSSIVFDEAISDVTNKLSFKTISSESGEDYLYAEQTLGGFNAIAEQKGGIESGQFDLELLFNGIITETQLFKEKFWEL